MLLTVYGTGWPIWADVLLINYSLTHPVSRMFVLYVPGTKV